MATQLRWPASDGSSSEPFSWLRAVQGGATVYHLHSLFERGHFDCVAASSAAPAAAASSSSGGGGGGGGGCGGQRGFPHPGDSISAGYFQAFWHLPAGDSAWPAAADAGPAAAGAVQRKLLCDYAAAASCPGALAAFVAARAEALAWLHDRMLAAAAPGGSASGGNSRLVKAPVTSTSFDARPAGLLQAAREYLQLNQHAVEQEWKQELCR